MAARVGLRISAPWPSHSSAELGHSVSNRSRTSSIFAVIAGSAGNPPPAYSIA